MVILILAMAAIILVAAIFNRPAGGFTHPPVVKAVAPYSHPPVGSDS